MQPPRAIRWCKKCGSENMGQYSPASFMYRVDPEELWRCFDCELPKSPQPFILEVHEQKQKDETDLGIKDLFHD